MALPARQQRPLFDARLEGERALHFLETLPPAALFSELLALGYSAAVQVLSTAGPAATLPAVRTQLSCLATEAAAALQRGVAAPGSAAWDTAATAAEGEQAPPRGGELEEERAAGEEAYVATPSSSSSRNGAPQRQPSWLRAVFGSGICGAEYRRLLLLLGCVEQTVVAAHSLLLRLDHGGGDSGSHGTANLALRAAGELVATALGDPWLPAASRDADATGQQAPAAAAASMARLGWPETEQLLLHRRRRPRRGRRWPEGAASTRGARCDGDSGGSGGSSERDCDDGFEGDDGWPEPFQLEWLVEVLAGGGGGGHRMYIKSLPAEVRIATAISPETVGPQF